MSAPAFMKSGTLWSGSTIIYNGPLKLNISKSIFKPVDLKLVLPQEKQEIPDAHPKEDL